MRMDGMAEAEKTTKTTTTLRNESRVPRSGWRLLPGALTNGVTSGYRLVEAQQSGEKQLTLDLELTASTGVALAPLDRGDSAVLPWWHGPLDPGTRLGRYAGTLAPGLAPIAPWNSDAGWSVLRLCSISIRDPSCFLVLLRWPSPGSPCTNEPAILLRHSTTPDASGLSANRHQFLLWPLQCIVPAVALIRYSNASADFRPPALQSTRSIRVSVSCSLLFDPIVYNYNHQGRRISTRKTFPSVCVARCRVIY